MPGWRIAELLAAQAISAVEVIERTLERIDEMDPRLHAFEHIDRDHARAQARVADAQIAAGGPLGPLHGVPVAVIAAGRVEGMPDPLWDIARVEEDSILVERLRQSGAIIVGTTASYFFEPDKRPLNPWDTSRDPGNSSRGSAVAVASGMVPIAIGMDGMGSTRLPAAWSGVIGLHTTRGLIPHVDYNAPSLLLTASYGPITRNVRDCALTLQALAGPDGRDFVSVPTAPPDYLDRIDDGVAGLRIAWTNDFGWAEAQAAPETPDIIAVARNAAAALADDGATVDETHQQWWDPRPSMFSLGGVLAGMGYIPPVTPMKLYELEVRLDEALGLTAAPPPPTFDPPPTTADQYRVAAEDRAKLWAICEDIFASHDVLLSPTTPMQPRTLEEWGLQGRHHLVGSYTAHTVLFNFLGLPAISVPCGMLDGLPVGLQIAGPPGSEDALLRVAHAVHKRYPLGTPPAAL
ncbi:amidase [Sphingopyxis granuli]|uniref:amidase n=1 Tax=Sphingopyxis granuli TaxID=267128 RepID=UPI00301D8F69